MPERRRQRIDGDGLGEERDRRVEVLPLVGRAALLVELLRLRREDLRVRDLFDLAAGQRLLDVVDDVVQVEGLLDLAGAEAVYMPLDAGLIGDGVHPNASGYVVMAEAWLAAIQKPRAWRVWLPVVVM